MVFELPAPNVQCLLVVWQCRDNVPFGTARIAHGVEEFGHVEVFPCRNFSLPLGHLDAMNKCQV